MWRGSWRFLSQVSRSCNLPPLSCLPSTHLGLQRLRLLSPSLNGSCATCFSAVAEAANMANSAEAEASSSVDHSELVIGSTDDCLAASASATVLKFDGEQGESALIKIIDEHRQLVSTLRAELEEHKTLTSLILNEIRVIKLKGDTKSAETQSPEKKVPWLEWTAFMEHLQDTGYFKDEKRAPLSNGGSSIFEDPECVKMAVQKFSQAHGSIFQSLSQIDLRIVARYGCVINDVDAAASQKILRQHFHLADVLTEDIGDKSANIQPKLSDVTRLLHGCIVEGTLQKDVRLSISHLLREIISLSRKSSEASSPISFHLSPTDMTESPSVDKVLKNSKPDKRNFVKEERTDIKKPDISLGEEESSSLGKVEASLERTAPSAPQWKCPRCSFMNLDTKHRCVECSRRRPQRTYAADAARSCDQMSLGDEGTEEEVIKVKEKKSSSVSSPVQERGNAMGRSSLASRDSESDQSSSEDEVKNAEVKDPFDVLDDILESKDLDENEESSEEPKMKSSGSGKQSTSLSGLFSRPSTWELERRNDSRSAGPAGRRLSRGSLPKARDSNRHVSLGTDEDESNPSDNDLPSHKGYDHDDDEGYGRRNGREKFSSFRGRGGGRGYRGDSYDDRRPYKGSRGPREFGDRDRQGSRGPREYGDRDRGSRSDNYGSRSERGRTRY
ncbi:hypothetical protein L7F22_010798 [Adiantum nelumboides]|nr:hypothetical protein [Adiantum nelumboides]